MLGLLLAVTVTSAAAGDGAAAPQVPKKAANFGVRQVAWMPLAVEQDELRRPVPPMPAPFRAVEGAVAGSRRHGLSRSGKRSFAELT